MTSLSVVTFSRNNVEEALGLLESFRSLADQAVVIDSSDPARADELRRRLPSSWATVYPAPAVGYIDLLRPYAVARARSERVIMIDGDETPSAALRQQLPSLEGDAYVVPRLEADLGAYTRHLRIFRRSAVRFRGPAYGFPEVDGTVTKLPRTMHLIHHADHRRYFEKSDRQAFGVADSYERPFSRERFRQFLRIPAPRPARESEEPLSAPGARLWIFLQAASESIRTGSLSWGNFVRRYQLRRWEEARSMGPEVLRERLRRTAEIRAAGGMIRYLGFDDPDYVERPAVRLPTDLVGGALLESLLNFRASHPEPIPTANPDQLAELLRSGNPSAGDVHPREPAAI